jgi:hypothetical protein
MTYQFWMAFLIAEETNKSINHTGELLVSQI